MDYLAHAKVLLKESARLIDGNRAPYVRVFEALTAVGIASVEQQIELTAKVERALQMANSIISYGDLSDCEPCPRCEEQGHNCICDTVPGP